MLELLGVWILSSAAIYLTAAVTPGFVLKGFSAAMIASVVIGLLNMTIRPVLLILTLPINILTLGLFTIVVNAIVLRISAGILKGFDINGWLPAFLGAIVLALVQAFLFYMFGPTAAEVQRGVAV
jgi:putative membrane protein